MNGSFILLEYLFIYLHFEKISKKNYLFTSETFTKKKRNCEMKLNWIDDLKCEKKEKDSFEICGGIAQGVLWG